MKWQGLIICSAVVFLFSSVAFGQSNIDISHYKFEIKLNDRDDSIKGIATISFIATKDVYDISLDLVSVDQGAGMICENVYAGQRLLLSRHENDKLTVVTPVQLKIGDSLTLSVHYKGIPADGLIISKSKYGKRTFFSDNWPDRAHNWIPCNDIPADKASVEFIVTAPGHYKVVSNGILIEEKQLPDNKKLTHWKEDVPLPTKIMVIGVADFAVDTSGIVNGIPVTSWVFPENKKDGFHDYSGAKDVLGYFINYIGPYPFKKLANVQSKTIFGGMENASAIFYNENTITGQGPDDRLLAHEITHQWFGDMVTEKTFAHLWLSEGFADYFSNIFIESKYGTDSLNYEMQKDRYIVTEFAKESDRPVVDLLSPYMQLLNANSYQKGAWVLHMLRRQLGNSVFQQIIRNFYAALAGKNADTKDFQKICEKVSGKNLETFFRQWLYTPGHPKLKVKWSHSASGQHILLTVEQLQKDLFQFPLDVEVKAVSGESKMEILNITQKNQQFKIPVNKKPTLILLDPKSSLLFEGDASAINN